ncbi:MAG: citrate lyase holo-[acyl-carrier protein] synthase [Sulfurospirillaceae bacterium]|nr:citrate lyase holo-[acyl-carrier protein] synthase [Sulfurospirillaceae bacterium]
MVYQHATLQAILSNKEERVKRQKEFLSRFDGASLISLSINTPGSIKLSCESLTIYDEAFEAIQNHALPILHLFEQKNITGAEAIWVIQADATYLKTLTCKIESTHPLGRFMDIDVIDRQGVSLSRKALGYERRKCFVCEEDAFSCARSQKHTIQELNQMILEALLKHAFGTYITQCCVVAMQKEVELTPKPGLVDSSNSGAHNDMDIDTFYASIKAIKPYISQFLEAQPLCFDTLRSVGVACEKAMFEATNGINTHKGMVFCLALTCGALSSLKARQQPFTCKDLKTQIQRLCEGLVEKDLLLAHPQSAGARFFYETGSLGIRGIAQSGFALVFDGSLPFFQIQKALIGEEKALKMTLLWLMAQLDDSTLWSRGGAKGLSYVKTKADEISLHVKNSPEDLDEYLSAFDKDLTQKHLSPGGSADLLALTWLFSHITD